MVSMHISQSIHYETKSLFEILTFWHFTNTKGDSEIVEEGGNVTTGKSLWSIIVHQNMC